MSSIYDALGGEAPQSPGGPNDISSPRQGGGSPVDALQDAVDAIHAYMRTEGDPEDKASAAKILALVQQLIAKDQQDLDAGLGAGPGAGLIRKQAQRQQISGAGY